MSYDPVYDFQPHPADRTIADLRAQLAEAATFLDGLAERLSPRELETGTQGMFDRMAADCRKMASKLRNET